jgi:hypothetical protein
MNNNNEASIKMSVTMETKQIYKPRPEVVEEAKKEDK